ncbi:alpha/beta hydrolase [Blastococcus xanthinilyticus]|uniref:Alpha/beta hydrolase family protein n=1 Tax=Blastococcus xanthinilyticus TaxID=1564164 RepID=A0A5S5D4F1_9ACTN|nr:alpha/beta hydrolase [Blastococcus xanthinilyticus]TYP90811.1 alpha/beta hydrolase family protein [Blastococcus xanthinilyticus]
MRTPQFAFLVGLLSLAGSLTLAAQPQVSSPAPPLPFDAGCAAELVARLTHGSDDAVHVLGCDPAGRGRAVVAVGDPATADHVAVLVPGSGIDLTTLDDAPDPQHRPWVWARSLASAAGPATSVVLWVGYETPHGPGVDVATGRLARAAAPALVDTVAGLRSRPGTPPHLTVIGHSYGAVVVSLAAPELAAEDLVLLASPGARASDVTDLRTSARVFAARGPGDWIRFVPHLAVGDLGHGADPASPGFGARLLPGDDVRGHDGYFRPGSAALAGLAGVVTGAPSGGTA